MYRGMSTVLTASRNFAASHKFAKGEHGEMQYEFEVPCDSNGVVLVWAMHDGDDQAIKREMAVLREPREAMLAKTREMNRQLGEESPYFRCSDRKFEDIYYYLWSLYLMYYIDVQRGMKMVPQTQTAVNNFLGMHRYDAAFQIKGGSVGGQQTALRLRKRPDMEASLQERSLSKVAERTDRTRGQQGNDVALRRLRQRTFKACVGRVADLPAHGRCRISA
jgi:hypothetical protein